MAQQDLTPLTGKPYYQAMNTLGKIVLTGLYWLLFSIPIITAGAASCAALEEFAPENEEAHGGFRRFARNFSRHFRPITPLWLLFLAAAALLALDIRVYDLLTGGQGILGTVLKTLMFVLLNYLVGLLRILQYACATGSTATGLAALKAAAISTLLHWSTWTAMMLIDIALGVFFYFAPYFLFLVPILPGILAWMHSRMLGHACRPKDA